MQDTARHQDIESTERLTALFSKVYPAEDPQWFLNALMERIENHWNAIHTHRMEVAGNGHNQTSRFSFDQRDLLLITYPDIVRSKKATPLASLHGFLHDHLPCTFSFIHLLPFYPYSSDDGFSVIDYLQVDPQLGDWEDIAVLAKDSRLMFDAVVNHISAKSAWFTGYLRGDKEYLDYFIEREPEADYTKVVRPRVSPLFTSYQTSTGDKEVWTTFSPDQVDLNYQNPHLLLTIIDILLTYVARGAAAIRLDAINYLWKQPGSNCSNLDSCHAIIQMIRAVFDLACPWVVIVTETNIPHADNITYFGDGYHEAQIIYQFALPPLVVHSFLSGEMRTLSGWAEKLDFGTDTSYLNFLASHDGVGIIPATGILAPSELDALVHLAHNRGGYVSYKASPQGGQLPYELNCTYYDLICDPMDPEELNIRKFITSQAILLALRGIPALYYHSLFGSRNFSQGVSTTGMKRTVNRKKFTREEIESLLEPTDARTAIIFNTLKHLIEIRKQHPAFSPHARQCMLDLHPALLSFYRTLENEETILTLANASRQPVTVDIPDVVEFQNLASCVAGQAELHQGATPATVTVPAYGFAWLLLEKDHA
ncbi:MAG: sugar phosphorylase [Spirochaetae bacterium HGW-Spirochaetae-8]|nr:MAG: sugar phosphorylase [Spirochaetae bacterium HGW-Spirochaetae-8]